MRTAGCTVSTAPRAGSARPTPSAPGIVVVGTAFGTRASALLPCRSCTMRSSCSSRKGSSRSSRSPCAPEPFALRRGPAASARTHARSANGMRASTPPPSLRRAEQSRRRSTAAVGARRAYPVGARRAYPVGARRACRERDATGGGPSHSRGWRRACACAGHEAAHRAVHARRLAAAVAHRAVAGVAARRRRARRVFRLD